MYNDFLAAARESPRRVCRIAARQSDARDDFRRPHKIQTIAGTRARDNIIVAPTITTITTDNKTPGSDGCTRTENNDGEKRHATDSRSTGNTIRQQLHTRFGLCRHAVSCGAAFNSCGAAGGCSLPTRRRWGRPVGVGGDRVSVGRWRGRARGTSAV